MFIRAYALLHTLFCAANAAYADFMKFLYIFYDCFSAKNITKNL